MNELIYIYIYIMSIKISVCLWVLVYTNFYTYIYIQMYKSIQAHLTVVISLNDKSSFVCISLNIDE